MVKKEVIEYFGSCTAIAEKLGVSKSSVSQWGEIIPPLRAYQIERLTGGQLKAEEPELKKAG
ncbi:MAG TPA: Cro/Cl family transcriptional regulator [Alteromonas australica]|uniref:Cro/Cl family transcriptional regulator n=1 Tax=Alteromonas australica TaxID=589873 RepID=A0A350P0W0_9ALTE|nr:Cro/CI family transcriptional regulator [Alteromonas australica]MBU35342.1 Cro/Cl family transcriptional regulator [Alteromonas sp.]HAW74927.1 Cro/Cl family transcriptional regulator [Alteromonas australica]HBU52169.1 Cro/Cl family transcriptional regulator [Alteromonas australica]|tara:strand:- start:35878 stop:36063 length:186 start_codon:yes stop_codon:yes gene_type:complete